MTKLPVRFALPLSAVFVLGACGIDSETSSSLASGGGASGAAIAGRGGSFVGEPGGSTGSAGKGAGAGSGGVTQGQAGTAATGGKAGTTSVGGAGGGTGEAGSTASGGTNGGTNGSAGSGTAGHAGSTSTGGSGSTTGAGAGGTGPAGQAGVGGSSSTNGGNGGTSDPAGGQAGNVAAGGTGPTDGGTGGVPSDGGAGGSLGMGGNLGTGGALGVGGFGTGGRAGTGPGTCGNGKIDKGEDCDPLPSTTNPNPDPIACNSECKHCPGLLRLGQCYFVPKAPKVAWDGAAQVCATESARLATPDITDFDALKNLPGNDDILWAAVRQADDAASATAGWTWRSGPKNGTAVTALIWSDNEPNDLGHADESTPGEDCGAVIRSRGMKYDDKVCTDKLVTLCQRTWN